MKLTTYYIITTVFICFLSLHRAFSQDSDHRWPITIVIHGGAGTITRANMSRETEEEYRNKLSEALNIGYEALASGRTALDAITSAILVMEDSPQNPKFHPEGNVFEHTVLVMEKLVGKSVELQFAGMLHDIGKPSTMVIKDGQPTNKGHAEVGAKMTKEIMLRLKFSNNFIKRVKFLIADHMKLHQVRKFKKSTLKRYLALSYIEDLITLGEADALSATGDLDAINFIREKQQEIEPEVIKPVPLITGKDLIDLGFKPGPSFGIIIEEIEDLQLEELLIDKKDAIKYINSRYIFI